MAESDPLRILLKHDHWASGQILDACANLTDEQFHQRFEIGRGSLHDTLLHIISAMQVMADALAGQAQRQRLDADGRRRTRAELRSLFDQTARDSWSQVEREPLAHRISRTLSTGQTLTLTRGAVFAHIATHGMHHRAQCLFMLRHLGVDPLPPSSVVEWTWLGDTEP